MLRREAHQLLNRLVASREVTERRLQETGRRDPLRTVTGTTAIERAIACTRNMIADMDVLLAELDHGIQDAEAEGRAEGDAARCDGYGGDSAFLKPSTSGARSRGMLVATR
jgi:hypothetical protein